MEFQNQNASNFEEVVQPQGAQAEEEVAQPQGMQEKEEFIPPHELSDEEFGSYIKGLSSGNSAESKSGESVGSATLEANTREEDQKKQAEPFMTFGTKEEFQGHIDKIIGERLKDARSQKEKYDAVAERARLFYGSENDADALERLLSDLENQAATERGVSVEEIRRENQERLDAQRFREIQRAEQEREQAISDIQARWERESEELRTAVPDFDFVKAMENENFRDLVLNKGMSIASAYITASKPSVEPPKRRMITEIGYSSKQTNHDNSAGLLDLSDDEFMRRMNEMKKVR